MNNQHNDRTSEAVTMLSQADLMEGGINNLSCIIGAISGDPASIAQFLNKAIHIPSKIQDVLFERKLIIFLKGIYSSQRDLINLCNILFSDDKKKEENAVRLLGIIDRISAESKIEYLINVTRSLSNGLIDTQLFFRLCNALERTLPEDLDYLREHVFDDNAVEGNSCVFGLVSEGLMISAGFDVDKSIDKQFYYVSPLGISLDRYGLSLYDEHHWEKHKTFKISVRMLHGIMSDAEYEEISKQFI